jgi:hypothetical protein
MNKGGHPKASKSILKADRPEHVNYFIYMNGSGKDTSYFTPLYRKLIIWTGFACTYTFFINTWNTLLESYQQREYKNTLAIFKHQVKYAKNSTPAADISLEAAYVDNAILLDYLTSKV